MAQKLAVVTEIKDISLVIPSEQELSSAHAYYHICRAQYELAFDTNWRNPSRDNSILLSIAMSRLSEAVDRYVALGGKIRNTEKE